MDALLEDGLFVVVFLSFLFSTWNKSSTCDVSIAAKLEFSCVITVFAIFSLNFCSLVRETFLIVCYLFSVSTEGHLN